MSRRKSLAQAIPCSESSRFDAVTDVPFMLGLLSVSSMRAILRHAAMRSRRSLGRLLMYGTWLIALLVAASTLSACNLVDSSPNRAVPYIVLRSDYTSYPSIAFSPDGLRLVAAGDDYLQVWDMRDVRNPKQKPLRVSLASTATDVAFGPDGKTVASAHSDGTVRLWDFSHAATPAPVLQLKVTPGEVYSVAFSPDGIWLASGGGGQGGTARVQLWDLRKRAEPSFSSIPLSGHTDTVYAVAFSPDSRRLASVGLDGSVRLWDLSDMEQGTANPTILAQTDRDVTSVKFSPDGNLLATGSDEGYVRLWEPQDPGKAPVVLDTCATTPPTPDFVTDDSVVASIAFSPDNQTLAVDCGQVVKLLDIGQATDSSIRPDALNSPVVLGEHYGNINSSMAFSPDGRMLALGTYVDSRVWELDSLPGTPQP